VSGSGFDRYPLWWVLGQNLLFVAFFALGTWAMAYIGPRGLPIPSILYGGFVFVMLCFVLRRELCTHCRYYGGLCGTGWGLWASWLFEEGSGNYERGLKAASVFWVVALLLPIVSVIAALIWRPGLARGVHLLALLILGGAIFLVHRETCRRCQNASGCPASMSKGRIRPTRPPSNG